MKLELEQKDIESIAQKVADILTQTLVTQPPVGIQEQILNVRELAEYLKSSTKWIYERVQFNEIPFIKIRGHLRFRKDAINEWLRTHEIPAVSDTYQKSEESTTLLR